MSSEVFDFVIPLYRVRWNTRAVLEGITTHYQPRSIHVIAPAAQVDQLKQESQNWQTSDIYLHEEETFFNADDLTKDKICAELDLGQSYLLPVDTWALINQQQQHSFALLQHNGWGNNSIVSKWSKWITDVLGVEALTNQEGTFVPHHMWFKQQHLQSFASQVNQYYQSESHWLLLMMRSANEFGTFSEYWSYVSWVATQAPEDISFYPYESYGVTSERFFDDGTGLFSAALKQHLNLTEFKDDFSPTYADIESFIKTRYGSDLLPSSLSFESSPRHLKKDEQNMHIEELRSRWNPRNADSKVV